MNSSLSPEPSSQQSLNDDTSAYSGRSIEITGARTHNLKSVTCQIAHRSLTVITGVSGSGKSSLAFDTLYAEGQRRYIESLSTYARQFIERLEKPDVDRIQHILPAVALEQNNRITHARSTVGTVTELADYLRMLFAHAGHVPFDMRYQAALSSLLKQKKTTKKKTNVVPEPEHYFEFVDAMAETLSTWPEKSRLVIGVEVDLPKGITSTEKWGQWIAPYIAQGYTRYQHPETGATETLSVDQKPKSLCLKPLVLVIDRVVIKPEMETARLREAIESALKQSRHSADGIEQPTRDGRVVVMDVTEKESPQTTLWQHTPPIALHPNQFSFNHPQGACTSCEGFGRVAGLDARKIIPNPTMSLADGAIHPFSTPAHEDCHRALMAMASEEGIDIHAPYQSLSAEEKEFIWHCSEGITPFFKWLERKRYKMHVRIFMAKYRGYEPCPDCEGSRLSALGRSVEVQRGDVPAKTLGAVSELSFGDLKQWMSDIADAMSADEQDALSRVFHELHTRLDCLIHLGLGYLTVSRHSRTLSGGEMQRIQMASALGSWLTETLYVLDEPTVGLHPRDTDRLMDVLNQLKAAGNTLVLVEHDPDVMMTADAIIDMGPKAGREGGEIMFCGTPDALLHCEPSATAIALRARERHTTELSRKPRKAGDLPVLLRGVSGHNVDAVTVSIPTNQLVCVTGVSGSGKSTLIKHGLYANAQHAQGKHLELDATQVDSIDGLEQFSDVVMVDQSPPGRSQRSNPATYLKAYDAIRKLFGSTRRASVLGLNASHFSFNRPGGRCEKCEGMGFLTIDMQFMSDVTVTCPLCRGRRFDTRVLSIDVHGKNIEAVLNMTVDDAILFFNETPKIVQCLQPLQDIGLGYLQLGQSTSTLSGGEAQRLKLAAYLLETETKAKRAKSEQMPYLFLFDEPTTGLHMKDIDVLLGVFDTLLERGHSMVVIEHHTDVMRAADTLIDMGPEGGDGGGRIVAQGRVADIKACSDSITGRYL